MAAEAVHRAPTDQAALGPVSLDMTGRRVVVTGGARGIGAATAALFGRLGASVATCDRLTEGGFEDGFAPSGPGGAALLRRVLDVREPEAVDRFVEEVIERFSGIDVLVNNAGGSFVAPVLDVRPKGEAMLVAENFSQALHFVRRCVPAMPAGASIVNVTSIEAHQASPGFGIYSAMKAALDNLTRTLALELAPQGIRVNAIAPDGIPSPGEQGARQQLLAADAAYEPAFVPPLGHFGSPEDAAGPILFLSSPLSRFMTGTTLHVDGGNFAAGGWHRVTR